MIEFRCWYCNRRYAVPDSQIGQQIVCTCKYPLRVPKRRGQSSRVRTAVDWLLEVALYGGGGALLGLCLAVYLLMRMPLLHLRGALPDPTWLLMPALTGVGFVVGVLGGERGINWIGRRIRERERP